MKKPITEEDCVIEWVMSDEGAVCFNITSPTEEDHHYELSNDELNDLVDFLQEEVI